MDVRNLIEGYDIRIKKGTANFIQNATDCKGRGDYFQALRLINNALALTPEDGPANITKVRILFDLKDYLAVADFLDNLHQRYPKTYDWFNGKFWHGLAYHNLFLNHKKNGTDAREDFLWAIYFYRQAINYDQYKQSAYLYLARLLTEDNLEDALDCYDSAAKTNKSWPTPLFEKAKVLFEKQDIRLQVAIQDFVEKFPFNALQTVQLLERLGTGTSVSEDLRPSEHLYHYTNGQGLKGILENGKVWMTRIDFLNDPTERTHFSTVLKTIISEAQGPFKIDLLLVSKLFEAIIERTYRTLLENCARQLGRFWG